MTGEPRGERQKAAHSPDDELADNPQFRVLKIVDVGKLVYTDFEDRVGGAAGSWDYEMVAAGMAVAVFSKAFLETLGRRAGDGVADLPKRVGDLVRRRIRKNGKSVETHIGTGDDRVAVIVVTDDLPDEARLALLDLDVTAPELRGKLLGWTRQRRRGSRSRQTRTGCLKLPDSHSQITIRSYPGRSESLGIVSVVSSVRRTTSTALYAFLTAE